MLFFEKFNVKSLSNLPILFLLKTGPEISVVVDEKEIFLFPNFSEIENLENFSLLFYKNYSSRAPPKI